MATKLTPTHLKDPTKFVTEVNAAFGKVVVDKWGVLDPHLAERQINAQVGTPVFRKTGPLDRGITDPHWTADSLWAAMGLS